jgi:hypothetical protein
MIENRNREIEDYKQKCQKYEITVMELKNYENTINDCQNKLALLTQELHRLNLVLKDKEEELHGYKQK